jgi:hypothetical protein
MRWGRRLTVAADRTQDNGSDNRFRASRMAAVAAQYSHVADLPWRGVFDASDFEKCFPDLSVASSQGRRLMHKLLSCNLGER